MPLFPTEDQGTLRRKPPDWKHNCGNREIIGSTRIFNECNDCHNHTDFSDEHFHEFYGKTSGAIDVGNGRHVHFIKDFTEEQDGHKHEFQAAALIDSPTDFKFK